MATGKREVAKTTGNLTAIVVDHSALLDEHAKAVLRAARKILLDLSRKL